MENNPFIVDAAPVEERVSFYRRTYLHVAGALLGFAALLALFFTGFDQKTGIAFVLAQSLFGLMSSLGTWSWLLVMAAFWVGTMVAQGLASNRASVAAQYAGLGLYVLLQALMFIPLLAIVHGSTGGQMAQILVPACSLTGALVVGLTLSVFMTSADFSFLHHRHRFRRRPRLGLALGLRPLCPRDVVCLGDDPAHGHRHSLSDLGDQDAAHDR